MKCSGAVKTVLGHACQSCARAPIAEHGAFSVGVHEYDYRSGSSVSLDTQLHTVGGKDVAELGSEAIVTNLTDEA